MSMEENDNFFVDKLMIGLQSFEVSILYST